MAAPLGGRWPHAARTDDEAVQNLLAVFTRPGLIARDECAALRSAMYRSQLHFVSAFDNIGDSKVLVVEKRHWEYTKPLMIAAVKTLDDKIKAFVLEVYGHLVRDAKHDISIAWVVALLDSSGAPEYPYNPDAPGQCSMGDCSLVSRTRAQHFAVLFSLVCCSTLRRSVTAPHR